MTPIVSFRDLDVWHLAMDLAVLSYAVTGGFPIDERYGLTSQIRRAATSIPANVAEGHGRPNKAYRNHVSIALGSQAELDTLLELAVRLRFLPAGEFARIDEPLRRVGQMLHGLARSLAQSADATE
jgi:four helix bundle protein